MKATISSDGCLEIPSLAVIAKLLVKKGVGVGLCRELLSSMQCVYGGAQRVYSTGSCCYDT